jgi:hypothetical protein
LQECITPPASTKKVAAKKKNQDLTPSKHSNRALDEDKRSSSTAVAKKRRKKPISLAPVRKKRVEELEWRYMKDGVRKVPVTFSDDSNDSDYECSDD